MKTLVSFKKQLIDLLVKNELRELFYVLRQNVDNQSDKHDDLCLIHAQHTTASHDQNIKGILTAEDARITFNKIKAAILDLINSIEEEDLYFIDTPKSPSYSEKKIVKNNKLKGKILYRIPEKMALKKQYKCIVRIAFSDEELEFLNKKDSVTKVEPIRIAEIMEVQFIDTNHHHAFNIKSLTNTEQLIDQGDFTEWIFYVETLLEGTYDLMLKVSVIEKKYDREVRKDIVLEKKITVVAEAVNQEVLLGKTEINEQQNSIIAGNALWLIGGFEELDVPFSMDTQIIPPLNPAPPPTAPPPPPQPPVDPFSWSLIFKIAGALVVGGIAYLLWPKSPTTDSLPSYFSFIDNKKDTIISEKKTSINEDIQNKKGKDLILGCRAKEEEKLLEVVVLDGKFPIEVVVTKDIPNSPAWKFALKGKQDSILAYNNISFLDKGRFQAIATDHLNKKDTVFFILKNLPSLPNFKLNCSHNAANSSIKISIPEGNRPPFKIFINGKPEATLNTIGPHYHYYRCGTYKEGQQLTIKASDNQNKILTKNITLQNVCKPFDDKITSIRFPVVVPDFPLIKSCLNFDIFKECTMLYVYKKETPDNWKMRTQTFSDNSVINKLKKINIHSIDAKTISSTCTNKELTNLNCDVTTFIFYGKNKGYLREDCFITPERMNEILSCDNKEYYRVQIAAFSDDIFFKTFMKRLEKFGFTDVQVRKMDNKNKVFLEQFNSKGKAIDALLRLEKNAQLLTILDPKINGEMMVKKW